MKFGILTQYYPPEIGAPQARLSSLARAFRRRNHDVFVLTALPSYPTGRIFPGYRGTARRETAEGVVLRAPIFPTQRAGIAPRMLNYLSFATSAAALGSARFPRVDYLMVESPPLFLGPTGVWLRTLKRARMIFNVSDLWPETAIRLGRLERGSWPHRASERLERFCYEHAWMVTGQSREIVDDIAGRFPNICTYHLSNGVETDLFGPDKASEDVRRTFGDGGQCIALYAGLHGLAQGLDRVVRAMELLEPESPVRLVMVGDGPEKARLRRMVAQSNASVRLLDPRPHTEIPRLLAAADIVVVPLCTRIPGAVPSKLYEAMASGRPVLLMAEGEAATVVRETESGLVVVPGDAPGFAQVLKRLAAHPELRTRLGANGRKVAVERFDRQRIADRFIDMLEGQVDSEGR